jgi:molybdenum cofactor cytidylyltransferase
MNKTGITGLIICAGLSQRMGQLKPLLMIKEKPFLIHIIQKLDAVCDKVVIVTGYKSEYIKNEISSWLEKNNKNKLNHPLWLYNPAYKKGMLSSLQTAAKNIINFDWILYHFVDQPDIPAEFYQEFSLQANQNYDWIQPRYQNQEGHPILFSKLLIPKILSLTIKQSLRDISKDKKLKKKYWDCNFPEILHDYDTPEQLKELTDKE